MVVKQETKKFRTKMAPSMLHTFVFNHETYGRVSLVIKALKEEVWVHIDRVIYRVIYSGYTDALISN